MTGGAKEIITGATIKTIRTLRCCFIEFGVLVLVERYEETHFPIGSPDPVDAIKFRMEQEGLRQKDLEKYFPSKSRVSEVLNHKRPLSLGMIRALHKGLGIPASVLVQ